MQSSAAFIKDLQLLRTPEVTADTNAIQNTFMQIVRDIRKDADSTIETQKAVTAKVLELLRANLNRGEEAVDLKSITAEDLTGAVIKTVSSTGVPEEDLSFIADGLPELLNKLKGSLP